MSSSIHNKMTKDLGSFHMEQDEVEKSSVEEEFFDPNLSKKKKIIFWIYLLSLLGFIIVVLTLVSKAYDPVKQHLLSDNFYFSNQVVNEWNQGFITEIKVLNASTNPHCPTDYEHAFTYTWRGTGYGCLCVSGQNTTFVLEAYCSPSLIQSNCTNIPSQDEKTSNYWSNNANICIKRSIVSFANEQKFDNTNKICGSSQSLTVVPTNQPCPLVNISMSTFSLESHIYTAVDLDGLLPKIYAAYNSTSPYSFYSYPIIKFAVSEDTYCQINEDTGVSDNHVDFVLLSMPRGCQTTGNYTTIAETTELEFYSNNPNLKALTQIKGFPEAGNWKYKMGFAAMGSWTYKCRHNLNGKFSISNTSKQFNFDIYGLLQTGSFIMISCCIVIAIEIFLLGLRRCINNSIYPVGYKQHHMPQQFWWAMSRYIIDVICKILIIIFSALFAYNGYLDWHWYKEVQNHKCHHDNLELVTYIIKPYQTIHYVLFENSLAVFVIAVVMLIVDAFHFYYIYHNELAYFLVENGQVLVDKDAGLKKQDSLERMNDLKWLEVENVEELQANKNDDELRITMAQNLYAYEENESPIIKPKKGKKPTKKKLFNKDGQKNDPTNGGNGAGYLFDDDLFALDNIDEPSTTVLKASSPSKSKKPNNRRKK